MYSVSKAVRSPAVSRTRWAVPGPSAVWHDAQLLSRIGRTSSANEIPAGALATSAAVVVVAASVVETVEVVVGFSMVCAVVSAVGTASMSE